MKLSMEIYALQQRFGDKRAAELIAAAGFDCIDYSYYWQAEDSPVLGDGYLSYAKDLRAHLDAVGIACNQAHAPFVVKYGDAFDESNPRFLQTVRAIEAASVLGADCIVVHSIGIPEEEKGVELADYNDIYFKSLEPYCKKYGIRIAVENLFSRDKKRRCFKGRFGTPAELCGFLRRLNSPWFVACIDVGHAALVGCEPEDFIAGMERGMLKSLHIQDNDYLGDCHVLPYMGQLNWQGITAALKDIAYDGELTFEIFKFLGRIPDGLVPDALRFAVAVGRDLIARIEQ